MIGKLRSLLGRKDAPAAAPTRLPPPGRDRVRLSFLVSDGLYFGDGEMAVMSREALGGPVIARAGELLQLVVAAATK